MSLERATRVDVARLAGVSTATVLTSSTTGRGQSPLETRERVLKAIAQLDYVPNDFARSLKGAGSSTIGYLVPNIRNPFFAEMTSAFNKTLQLRGYQLLLADLDDDQGLEASYLELFRKKDVDGVVAWRTNPSIHLINFLTAKDIPFALVASRHPNASSVLIDEQGAAEYCCGALKSFGAPPHRLSRPRRRRAFSRLAPAFHYASLGGQRTAVWARGILRNHRKGRLGAADTTHDRRRRSSHRRHHTQ